MANRTRDIPIQFFVTAEEKKMIRKKMILSKTANMGAYLRKMAIDGIIVNTDTTYLEKQFYEMHKIGVNVNQLARLANSTGAVTPEEMKELKGMIKEIWHQLHDATLKELAELGIHKLPSSEKLQRQQLELEEELASAKKEKQDLQKQQKALQVIEHNFDAMIREAGIKIPEKEPSPKTQEDILS